MSKLAVGWLKRGRAFFNRDLPQWIENRAEKLPSYRTNTMAVIANVSLRYFHDFTKIIILTICIAGMIVSGTILGVEEGANFVRIDTEGWTQDHRGLESRIYDIFDLSLYSLHHLYLIYIIYMIHFRIPSSGEWCYFLDHKYVSITCSNQIHKF